MKNYELLVNDLSVHLDSRPKSLEEFDDHDIRKVNCVAEEALDLLREMLPLIPKPKDKPKNQAPDGSWLDEAGHLRSGNGCYADPSEYDH